MTQHEILVAIITQMAKNDIAQRNIVDLAANDTFIFTLANHYQLEFRVLAVHIPNNDIELEFISAQKA